MGCDIHMYVEYTRDAYKGWHCGDYFHKRDPYNDKEDASRIELYDDRNYPLFAVLANVRNNGDYQCIDSPRGLPEDVTPYVKSEYESWGIDAHSCSYLTLREIYEFQTNNNPTSFMGYPILKTIIDRLIRRADELWLTYDFEWKDPSPEVLKKGEQIRIVFWFDN